MPATSPTADDLAAGRTIWCDDVCAYCTPDQSRWWSAERAKREAWTHANWERLLDEQYDRERARNYGEGLGCGESL